MKNDLVFECRKCLHLLFIQGTATQKINKIIDLKKKDCPNCGEEGEENWIFVRVGDFEKEYGSNN